MGLFDFLKRKSAPPAPPAEPDDGPNGGPRCGHYTFAHRALRSVALADPLLCLAALASPKVNEFFGNLLRAVDKECRSIGQTLDFAADALRVHRARIADQFPCAIVEMPTPVGITEAYMVAIVLTELPERPPEDPAALRARYFTLEYGASLERGEPRTVLCEWDKRGTHLNFGDGPPPTVAAFSHAIERFVAPGRDAGSS